MPSHADARGDAAGTGVAPAPQRVAYGAEPRQFGVLRVPAGGGAHPVAVVLHGGCWHASFGADLMEPLSVALTRAGFATWNLEYRSLGDAGGAWPGTFLDVARGTDHLRELARTYPLDLARVVAVGHSAGGHLALWLAARARIAPASELRAARPLAIRGVVSLAGVTDLRRAALDGVCGDAATQLIGGAPAEVPARIAAGSPVELLPLGVPQRLLYGPRDAIVPAPFALDYAARAQRAGDDARAVRVDDAGHFELIRPDSAAWPAVERAVLAFR